MKMRELQPIIYDRYSGKCAKCGKAVSPDDMRMHSIITPKSGGTFAADNMELYCPDCYYNLQRQKIRECQKKNRKKRSKEENAAINLENNSRYDRVTLHFHKGEKERLAAYAAKCNTSISRLLITALNAYAANNGDEPVLSMTDGNKKSPDNFGAE